MNACKHFQQPACPHHPLRPSLGTCGACPKYTVGTRLWAEVRVKGKAVPAKVEPLPHSAWPAWAKAIEKLRAPQDIGVGSTIDRQLGTFGKMYKATLKGLGVPCGCNRRKAEWDAKYPYSPQQPQQ